MPPDYNSDPGVPSESCHNKKINTYIESTEKIPLNRVRLPHVYHVNGHPEVGNAYPCA